METSNNLAYESNFRLPIEKLIWKKYEMFKLLKIRILLSILSFDNFLEGFSVFLTVEEM